MDLGENLLALGLPAVRLRILVALHQVGRDRVRQFLDAPKAAVPHAVRRQVSEEPLHQVQPGTRGGREVHVEALVLAQPVPHLRVLVRAIVVREDVNLETVRNLPVDLLEESQPLQMGVPRLGAVDQLAFQVAHRREQAHGAVPNVVVSAGAKVSDTERQGGLGALQRLALALLVAAQHHGLLGRVQVQADHTPELAFELFVAGEFECLGAVRLEALLVPYAPHAGGNGWIASDSSGRLATLGGVPLWRYRAS